MMADDDTSPELTPGEMDDVQLLIFRTMIRNEIAYSAGNVSPELSERYAALNDEVTKRIRGWS
jgi:hypothetical protein